MHLQLSPHLQITFKCRAGKGHFIDRELRGRYLWIALRCFSSASLSTRIVCHLKPLFYDGVRSRKPLLEFALFLMFHLVVQMAISK